MPTTQSKYDPDEYPITILRGGFAHLAKLDLVSGGGSATGLWHLSVWFDPPFRQQSGWYHIGQLFYAMAHDEWQLHEQKEFFGKKSFEELVSYIDSFPAKQS